MFHILKFRLMNCLLLWLFLTVLRKKIHRTVYPQTRFFSLIIFSWSHFQSFICLFFHSVWRPLCLSKIYHQPTSVCTANPLKKCKQFQRQVAKLVFLENPKFGIQTPSCTISQWDFTCCLKQLFITTKSQWCYNYCITLFKRIWSEMLISINLGIQVIFILNS